MNTEQSEEKLIAFILYPGLTPLDLIGPLQVLNSGRPVFRTVVVGEHTQPMETDTAVKLSADRTYAEAPNPYAVIVPGGGLPTYRAMADERLRDYLCAAAETAEVIGSVCTGALILAAAGLLAGRQATTHWAHYRVLEKLGARYVQKRCYRC